MSSWPCARAPRALMELSASRIIYGPEECVLSFFVLCVLKAPLVGLSLTNLQIWVTSYSCLDESS